LDLHDEEYLAAEERREREAIDALERGERERQTLVLYRERVSLGNAASACLENPHFQATVGGIKRILTGERDDIFRRRSRQDELTEREKLSRVDFIAGAEWLMGMWEKFKERGVSASEAIEEITKKEREK